METIGLAILTTAMVFIKVGGKLTKAGEKTIGTFAFLSLIATLISAFI